MAQFTIEIADEDVMTVIGSLCGMYGYKATVTNPDYDPEDEESEPMITNPQSAAQYANQVVRNFIKEVVTAYAVKQAESALQAAREAVAGISITDPTGA